MPIYDFDGSTSREIGKLYDWNGSTNSQIKEVYDFDGTTSRLIYKDAPDYLFNWGDNAEITGGWSVKKWVLSGSANGIMMPHLHMGLRFEPLPVHPNNSKEASTC